MTAIAHMDHDRDYPADYLATILKEVKTIAMVGASPDPTKFSYGVLRVLHETGYDMIPVNPNLAGGEIRGLRVYESLAASTGRWTWCRYSAAPMRCRDRTRGDRDRRKGAVDAARRAATTRRARWPRRRAEGGHEPLPEDRAVPPVLEASLNQANLAVGRHGHKPSSSR
jgi:hypothetical protein